MRKALLVTTVSGFVPQFEMNNVRLLQKMGLEVHYAANYHMPSYGNDNHRLRGTGIIRHQVDFVRSPFKMANLTAYRQLKHLMQKERFDLVHCHTPMGGVLARLAARATETRPVLYTAHGFHFYTGAPLINWLLYYPIERFLSRYTEQQICINMEDYKRAKDKFLSRYVNYIPGVGIDYKDVIPVTEERKKVKREELNISQEKIVLLSVGELIKRKNHEIMIKAIADMQDKRLLYVICGQGELEGYLKSLVKKMDVENQVVFLGYRTDIYEIYSIADLFVFPSCQEGLPMALLEAVRSGLPVICSDIRGSRDLMGLVNQKTRREKIKGKMYVCEGGILVKSAHKISGYVAGISYLISHKEQWKSMGEKNMKRAERFEVQKVSAIMDKIYKRALRMK
ncbi:glycosyltransferase family 4 protein [Lachnospiraceae bacterium 62-35]